MANFLKYRVFRIGLRLIPLRVLQTFSPCEIAIGYYHIVSDEKVAHLKSLYSYKNKKEFINDLDCILTNYHPIDLEELIRKGQGEGGPRKDTFLLTFDDGFREIYDNVAPILKEKGIPAAVFVCSAFLDNKELCYEHKKCLLVEKIKRNISSTVERRGKEIIESCGLKCRSLGDGIRMIEYQHRKVLDKVAELVGFDFDEYLKSYRPYMTSEQVSDLVKMGHSIGSHTIDHPPLAALSIGDQVCQALESTKIIREKFALNYGAFAFPHNDRGVSGEFFNKIEQSGILDVTFGTGGILQGDWPKHYQRVSLEKELRPAKEILAWQYMRKVYRNSFPKLD